MRSKSSSALAVERAQLGIAAQEAQVQAESERLRASLLSTVSHDLRTPLAVITGSLGSMIEGRDSLDAATCYDLAQTAFAEAERLSRLLSNLLDVTKIESGAVKVYKEWQPLEEVVGAALNRLDTRLQGRTLNVDLPSDLPLVPIDGMLIERVLLNLLENALVYTPAGTPLMIGAQASTRSVTVQVADWGPGLPVGDEGKIFDKFYRTQRASSHDGVGLGLTICRGIVEAHGGRIWAENRPGGAVFQFMLPINGSTPMLPKEQLMAPAGIAGSAEPEPLPRPSLKSTLS